jgi:hypothetical protein
MKRIGPCLSALLIGGFLNAQDLLKPLVVEGDAVGNVAVETLDAERLNELLGYLPGFASVASDSAGYGDIIGVRGSTNTLFFGGAGVSQWLSTMFHMVMFWDIRLSFLIWNRSRSTEDPRGPGLRVMGWVGSWN